MSESTELTGPWRFQLLRPDPMLVNRKPSVVADGVQFQYGACVLHWRGNHRSTAVYQNMDDLWAIHGHDATERRWIDEPPTPAFEHGVTCCYQDSCENAPFASVGGLEARDKPVAKYAKPGEEVEWLRGYVAAARAMYGDDWRTCEFGWSKAMTIGGEP